MSSLKDIFNSFNPDENNEIDLISYKRLLNLLSVNLSNVKFNKNKYKFEDIFDNFNYDINKNDLKQIFKELLDSETYKIFSKFINHKNKFNENDIILLFNTLLQV